MKKAFFTIGLLWVMGCQDVKKPEPPQNLISKDEMVDILADAYIGNAAKSINNRMLRTKGIYLDSVLYQKFGIDSLQFALSNAYYASDLNGYAKLLEQVEEQLVERKAVVDSLYEIEKEEATLRRDSIRKKDSIRVDSIKKQKGGTLTDPVQDEEE
ncbi:DUF4296 domain-containing protein [Aureisphaera galaxeae]|uniref:DUF4296 domain-containing protein n=1 Tax=Aureisphaera galaxeae TaxID=1538023 RepID=UPI0023505BA9|nr:DUF4296 domain-containing protein [Aureisphaera galaxeae]MDC8002786.1 DUF4296 domain-containing protein [Aureisphaera galaxeae]